MSWLYRETLLNVVDAQASRWHIDERFNGDIGMQRKGGCSMVCFATGGGAVTA